VAWNQQFLAPETEPLLTPDQEKIKKRNEASWGFGVPGNINQTAVAIPAKNIGSKVPEAAVNKTAQIFNSPLSEAEKKAADILQVPLTNEELRVEGHCYTGKLQRPSYSSRRSL
jgi:hypothetical protein